MPHFSVRGQDDVVQMHVLNLLLGQLRVCVVNQVGNRSLFRMAEYFVLPLPDDSWRDYDLKMSRQNRAK